MVFKVIDLKIAIHYAKRGREIAPVTARGRTVGIVVGDQDSDTTCSAFVGGQ